MVRRTSIVVNSGKERTGSSLPYYAFVACGAPLILGVLLLGTNSTAINVLVIVLALAVLAEGLALVLDWKGGAREFASRLQRDPNSILSFISEPLIRTVLGGTYVFLGSVLMAGGIKYL